MLESEVIWWPLLLNIHRKECNELNFKVGYNAGKDFFLWFGPTPAVHLSNPEFVREAFTKTQEFGKPKLNPLFHKLLPGLVSYEGEKWAKHRKLINPAFHVEKLKVVSFISLLLFL